MATVNHVVPGVHWGSLPVPDQVRWRRLGCDDVLRSSEQRRDLTGQPVVPVFFGGLGGYRVFRIPCLARAGRALLAFAEARPTVDDHGRIDLVLRRSWDGGRTWGGIEVVASGGRAGQTFGNPVPIYLPRLKRLLLLYSSNAAHLIEDAIRDGKGGAGRRVWLTTSDDGGGNWSAPAELTATVKRPGWMWYATGPGGAIITRNGTIVVPATHSAGIAAVSTGHDHTHVLLSHDDGATWHIGGVSPDGHTNEAAVAELPNGSLLLNSRDVGPQRRRVLHLSTDGGQTWGPPRRTVELAESPPRGSHGAMVAGGRDGSHLFFTAPSSPVSRGRLTLYRSTDHGLTWPKAAVLHAGPAAYSSMRALPGGEYLGVLYERGERSRSFFAERIVYARVSVSALEG